MATVVTQLATEVRAIGAGVFIIALVIAALRILSHRGLDLVGELFGCLAIVMGLLVAAPTIGGAIGLNAGAAVPGLVVQVMGLGEAFSDTVSLLLYWVPLLLGGLWSWRCRG
jgi:hypothetical protein